jgi:riboflavin kinase/FMN adenylyltransferase
MFDGVHRGHRLVIEAAVEAARREGGCAGVFTFWPHPSRLFRPEDPTRLIFGAGERRELLEAVGAEFVVEQPFTAEFARWEAESLVGRLRGAMPGLRALYVGENWRFGRGRRGDVSLLVELARREGVDVVSLDRVHVNGDAVSSTRIRGLLMEGALTEANTLLGFPYYCRGRVVPGKQLGRTIGVPTLNLDWMPDLAPAFGVYAVRVARDESGAASLPAVANFGVRPTVDGSGAPVLEVHVLGACPFDRGDALRVEWHARIRGERRFDSIEALRARIEEDRREASACLAYPKSGDAAKESDDGVDA